MPGAACRVYAPVGSHRDLLAYLVRRLLENGANSSFVAVAADPSVPIEDILKRPQAWIGDAAHARHPHIPLPRDLYRPARLNSSGVEFGDRVALNALVDEVKRAAPKQSPATPPVDKVVFEPFVGIAPKRYQHLFYGLKRKEDNGEKVGFDPKTAIPRLADDDPPELALEQLGYSVRETALRASINQFLPTATPSLTELPEEAA